MIEVYCKKCDHPFGEYEGTVCPSCGAVLERTSTLYWCDHCNIPTYEKTCPICGKEGHYIATDIRPVFPEENMLISLILSDDAFKYQKESMWYGTNSYIVNGKKIKFSVSKINKKSIEEIAEIKRKYDVYSEKLTYDPNSHFFLLAQAPTTQTG